MSINRILADLGKAVDSSSTGNFLNKEASGAEFNPVQWTDINSAPTILDSALASAIVDSAYVQARQTGVGGGGLDSATTISLIDSDYVGARASTGGSGFTKYQYTATASQTTFQDSDANGNVLSYDADYILVHYNGVLLPSADYTATDGSSVVLGTGADSGSIIGIAKWGAAAGSSSGGGAVWYGDRGVFMGGSNSSYNASLTIDYISIASPGNATDFGDMISLYNNSASASDGTYGVAAGGALSANNIEYVTFASPGNATDFGDLTRNTRNAGGVGDGTYGVFAGGYNNGLQNIIDYITVASPGNATDFGDLLNNKQPYGGAVSDGTYGVISGDATPNLEYLTIASPGNTTSFGDLTVSRNNIGATSDTTYGVFASGYTTSVSNVIDYITIASPGNATDFGDLTQARYDARGVSDATYGVFAGGDQNGPVVNTIDYVTIASPGNATDFGDLTAAYLGKVGASGSPS